jgi:hypothetical protein
MKPLIALCLLLTGSALYAQDPVAEKLNAVDTSRWYAWTAKNTPEAGAIGMADWLEKPAGKHGRIRREGDHYVCNGKPFKLWGVNLAFSGCFPPKDASDKRTALYAKYGLNQARIHKYADGCAAWQGILSMESFTKFNPERLDRMDYQIAKMKEAGIYFSLSPHLGFVPIGPEDLKIIPYAAEIAATVIAGQPRNAPDEKNPYYYSDWGALYFSPELQQLHIQHFVNLLRHRNPYTGQTYAEETALSYIEIVNEQSVFFSNPANLLEKSPTLRKKVGQDFTAWLTKKYGSKEALLKAFGGTLVKPDPNSKWPQLPPENYDTQSIWPSAAGWSMHDINRLLANPEAAKGGRTAQRALDTLEYLKHLQDTFFARFTKALREAGYDGEFIGSNWFASATGIAHLYNLASDREVGAIERHYYSAWNGGSMFDITGGGKLSNYASARPGEDIWSTGILSKGMEQVSDRPFGMSEWATTSPNDLHVEAFAIYAAYGMGLQGWDRSEYFYSDGTGFSPNIYRQQFNSPSVLGLAPAISRQVLRGDVMESTVLGIRKVHLPSLAQGKLSYECQGRTSDKIPARALAVARQVIQFTDSYEDTKAFDFKPYEKDGGLLASTGQLFWKEAIPAKPGYFTINAPATKAVVGYGGGQTFTLGEVTLAPTSPHVALYVTALEPDQTIVSSKKILVTAFSRVRPTGVEYLYDPKARKIVTPVKGKEGTAPLLVEPIQATVTLKRPGAMKVTLLDHDGLPTGRSVPVTAGSFPINGVTDKTPYYLIEFP